MLGACECGRQRTSDEDNKRAYERVGGDEASDAAIELHSSQVASFYLGVRERERARERARQRDDESGGDEGERRKKRRADASGA